MKTVAVGTDADQEQGNKRMKTIHAGNPHDANRGTRLSSSYAMGLRGLPCPPHSAEKTSAAYKAWLRGHKEFEARVVSGVRS